MTKKCTRCGELHEMSFYNLKYGKPIAICKNCSRKQLNALYQLHKVERREKAKKYLDLHREEINKRRRYLKHLNPNWKNIERDKNLKACFGLKLDHKFFILKAQNFECDICGKKLTIETAFLDHDHKTGQNRGVLCNLCNSGLGYFKENYKTMSRAIEYLSDRQLENFVSPQ